MTEIANAIPRGRHYRTGRRLMAFAWVVEVLAAAVGLLIAAVTGYAIREEMIEQDGRLGVAAITNILVGSLPFVMVAVVEITKIPLAIGFYNAAKLRWRLVFGVTLLFLILITFETALNGFERNFSNLTRTIQDQLGQILSAENQIAILQGTLPEAGQQDETRIREQFDQRLASIQRSRVQEIEEIDKIILDRRGVATAGRMSSLQASLESVRAQITRLQDALPSRLDQIRADYERQVEQLQTATRTDRQTLLNRLDQLDQEIRALNAEETAELERTIFLLRDGVRQRYSGRRATLEQQRQQLDAQVAAQQGGAATADRLAADRDAKLAAVQSQHQAEIGQLRQQETTLNGNLMEAQGQTQDALRQEIAGLEQRKQQIQTKWDAERVRAEQERTAALGTVQQRIRSATDVGAEKATLERRVAELKDSINDRVADNQVYRITALWTGQDDASLVSRDQLRFTMFAWFGSIALIVAITGTVLAFAGIVLMDEASARRRVGPVSGSLRRALLAIRKRINSPRVIIKEIEKERVVNLTTEVPVDKVVFRDVPREVVRRELVHVPLYTNDPALLGSVVGTEGKLRGTG